MTFNESSKSVRDQREENMMKWVGYWRSNPHRFAEDYLNINLFLFQKILLHAMSRASWFMYIASRGQGPGVDSRHKVPSLDGNFKP